jgi:hypothetical protein
MLGYSPGVVAQVSFKAAPEIIDSFAGDMFITRLFLCLSPEGEHLIKGEDIILPFILKGR